MWWVWMFEWSAKNVVFYSYYLSGTRTALQKLRRICAAATLSEVVGAAGAKLAHSLSGESRLFCAPGRACVLRVFKVHPSTHLFLLYFLFPLEQRILNSGGHALSRVLYYLHAGIVSLAGIKKKSDVRSDSSFFVFLLYFCGVEIFYSFALCRGRWIASS